MRRVVFLYYCFQFFFSLLIWLPIFYEYQLKVGLTPQEIFQIQSIYYIAFCLLEIPTGMFADSFGYRKCLRLGSLVLVMANVIVIFSANYFGFLLHFLLIALSRSFISGASSAYLYDYLNTNGCSAEYKGAEGKARAYGLIGKIICWSAVGVLMQWHLSLPYWLTAVSTLSAFCFSWIMPDIKIVKERSPWLQQLSSAGSILATTPWIFFLMFQGIAIFVLGRICQVNLFQPILNSKSFGIESYGIVMSVMTLFEAIGSSYPKWLKKYTGDLNAVFLLTIVMALSLALIAVSQTTGTLICLCTFSLAMGFAFPIQRQLLNDAIHDSSQRATILSIESIIDRAVCAWVASLIGQALGENNLTRFLMVSSIVTCAGMAFLFVCMRIYKRQSLIKINQEV
ncbi:MAG: MFS transporter [Deltaproteobacteria bacterium]|nr:MFS transporter [Deltaproteobacteria bacterium]